MAAASAKDILPFAFQSHVFYTQGLKLLLTGNTSEALLKIYASARLTPAVDREIKKNSKSVAVSRDVITASIDAIQFLQELVKKNDPISLEARKYCELLFKAGILKEIPDQVTATSPAAATTSNDSKILAPQPLRVYANARVLAALANDLKPGLSTPTTSP